MKFHLYQKNGTYYYLAMVFSLGAVTSLWATKASLVLAVVIASYWAYRTACVLINPTIYISETGREIETSRTALGFVFNKKSLPVSDYYGIRNRVHWGHYKHCQTELVGGAGKYLPIRVELMSEKISDEAVKFKSHFAKELNLENRPDIEHA
jgi:hypothetical protein